MKSIFWGTLCLFQCIFASVYAQPESSLFSELETQIHGAVYNHERQPLRDVTVTVAEMPEAGCLTNAQGHFKLQLPMGEHLLLFSRNGFKRLKKEVQIQKAVANDKLLVFFDKNAQYLHRTTYNYYIIEGQIQNNLGQGIPQAKVHLAQYPEYPFLADDTGKFRFALQKGTHELFFVHKNHTVRQKIEITADTTLEAVQLP